MVVGPQKCLGHLVLTTWENMHSSSETAQLSTTLLHSLAANHPCCPQVWGSGIRQGSLSVSPLGLARSKLYLFGLADWGFVNQLIHPRSMLWHKEGIQIPSIREYTGFTQWVTDFLPATYFWLTELIHIAHFSDCRGKVIRHDQTVCPTLPGRACCGETKGKFKVVTVLERRFASKASGPQRQSWQH